MMHFTPPLCCRILVSLVLVLGASVPCVAQVGAPGCTPLLLIGPPPPPPPVEIIWFQPNPEAPTWGPSGPPVWEYDVIAGSVVELEAPEIRDLDTYTDEGARSAGVPLGTQVEDHTWKYRVVEGGGDIVDPDEWTEYRTDRSFTWWAPVTDGDVTFTFWAKDYTPANEHWGTDNAPTSQSEEGNPLQYLTGVIHVHELEVSKLYRSGDLFENALYPTAPNPPHSWECEGWDNSTQAIPDLRYDADDPELNWNNGFMRFDGQQPATVRVKLRGLGGWTGPVLPATIRVRADWPEEGTSIEGWEVTVDELETISLIVETPEGSPPDDVVSLETAFSWDWEYEAACGTQWEQTVDVPADGQLLWVATSHDAALLPAEATPLRVFNLYYDMQGNRTHLDIAEFVGVWARAWVDFDGTKGWGGDERDVWCVICRGTADCLRGSMLCAEACNLLGVPSWAGTAKPQQEWDPDREPHWLQDTTCYSGVPGHAWRLVGYLAGNGYNHFEGFYKVVEPGGLFTPGTDCYYTWEYLFAPYCPYESLAAMVTYVSSLYACYYTVHDDETDEDYEVWTDHDPGTHSIPEPTP